MTPTSRKQNPNYFQRSTSNNPLPQFTFTTYLTTKNVHQREEDISGDDDLGQGDVHLGVILGYRVNDRDPEKSENLEHGLQKLGT